MTLLELEPRWVHPDIFAFRCPCCRQKWLTVKRIVMPVREQMGIISEALVGGWIPCRPEVAWKMSGDDFATMTVSPSLDASPSGHWHGHIKNGQIV